MNLIDKINNCDLNKSRKLLKIMDYYRIPEISLLEFYRTKALTKIKLSINSKTNPLFKENIFYKFEREGIVVDELKSPEIADIILTPLRLKPIKSAREINIIDIAIDYVLKKPISPHARELIIKIKDLAINKKKPDKNIEEIGALIVAFGGQQDGANKVYSFILTKVATNFKDCHINSFLKLIEPIKDEKYLDSIAVRIAMAILLEIKEKWLSIAINKIYNELIEDNAIYSYQGDEIELEILINIIHHSMLNHPNNVESFANKDILKWLGQELSRVSCYYKYLINELDNLDLYINKHEVKERIFITQRDIDENKIVFVLKKIYPDICVNDEIYNDAKEINGIDSENILLIKAKNKEYKEPYSDIENFPLFEIHIFHDKKQIQIAPREVLYKNATKNSQKSHRPTAFCKIIKNAFEKHIEKYIKTNEKCRHGESILGREINHVLKLNATGKDNQKKIKGPVNEILSNAFDFDVVLNKFRDDELIIEFDLHSHENFRGRQKKESLTGIYFDFE